MCKKYTKTANSRVSLFEHPIRIVTSPTPQKKALKKERKNSFIKSVFLQKFNGKSMEVLRMN